MDNYIDLVDLVTFLFSVNVQMTKTFILSSLR